MMFTYRIAEKGGVSLTRLGQGSEYEAKESLRRKSCYVLYQRDGIKSICPLRVWAHLRYTALSSRRTTRAEWEKKSGCLVS
jgi:hypothetical protein